MTVAYMLKEKVIITGAVGLVGQNVVQRLLRKGVTEVVAIESMALEDQYSANA